MHLGLCVSVSVVSSRPVTDAPPTARVGQPFQVDVTITNHTGQAHVLSAAVAEGDCFLLAGPRQALLDAPPHATQHFGFTLLPVVTGQARIMHTVVIVVAVNNAGDCR